MAKNAKANWLGLGCLFLALGPALLNVLAGSIVPIFIFAFVVAIAGLVFVLFRERKVQENLNHLNSKVDSSARVVILDTETTGLYPENGDRVIQISLIFLDENLDFVADFSTLFNPSRDVGRTDIHGITQGMVRIAPRFNSMARKLATVLESKVIVAHNADFDMTFLVAEFMQSQVSVPRFGKVIDTLSLARKHVGGVRNYKLMTLVEHLGIDASKAPIGRAHDARFDAWCCGELLKRILDDAGIRRSTFVNS